MPTATAHVTGPAILTGQTSCVLGQSWQPGFDCFTDIDTTILRAASNPSGGDHAALTFRQLAFASSDVMSGGFITAATITMHFTYSGTPTTIQGDLLGNGTAPYAVASSAGVVTTPLPLGPSYPFFGANGVGQWATEIGVRALTAVELANNCTFGITDIVITVTYNLLALTLSTGGAPSQTPAHGGPGTPFTLTGSGFSNWTTYGTDPVLSLDPNLDAATDLVIVNDTTITAVAPTFTVPTGPLDLTLDGILFLSPGFIFDAGGGGGGGGTLAPATGPGGGGTALTFTGGV